MFAKNLKSLKNFSLGRKVSRNVRFLIFYNVDFKFCLSDVPNLWAEYKV